MDKFPMPQLPSNSIESKDEGQQFLVAYLNNCSAWYLATQSTEQGPSIRPMSLITQHEGRVFFATQKKKDIYQEIKAESSIAISAYIPKSGYLVLKAQALELCDKELAQILNEKFSQENPSHYKHYLGSPEENVFYEIVEADCHYHRCHKDMLIQL